jgi:hypothetical protein
LPTKPYALVYLTLNPPQIHLLSSTPTPSPSPLSPVSEMRLNRQTVVRKMYMKMCGYGLKTIKYSTTTALMKTPTNLRTVCMIRYKCVVVLDSVLLLLLLSL